MSDDYAGAGLFVQPKVSVAGLVAWRRIQEEASEQEKAFVEDINPPTRAYVELERCRSIHGSGRPRPWPVQEARPAEGSGEG